MTSHNEGFENPMHYFLYIKARNEDMQREARRARLRREARDASRGR